MVTLPVSTLDPGGFASLVVHVAYTVHAGCWCGRPIAHALHRCSVSIGAVTTDTRAVTRLGKQILQQATFPAAKGCRWQLEQDGCSVTTQGVQS